MSAVITNDHQLHFVTTWTPFNLTAPMALRLQVISTLTILTSISSRMLRYRPNCQELTTLWVARLDDSAELKVTDPEEQHRDVEEEEAEG